MSSGLEWNESITSYGTLAYDETRLFWDWQPYRYVLSRPRVAKSGTHHAVRAAGHPRVGMGRRSLAAPARVRRPAHAPA